MLMQLWGCRTLRLEAASARAFVSTGMPKVTACNQHWRDLQLRVFIGITYSLISAEKSACSYDNVAPCAWKLHELSWRLAYADSNALHRRCLVYSLLYGRFICVHFTNVLVAMKRFAPCDLKLHELSWRLHADSNGQHQRCSA